MPFRSSVAPPLKKMRPEAADGSNAVSRNAPPWISMTGWSTRRGVRANGFASVSVPVPFLTSRPPGAPRSVSSVKSSLQLTCTKLFVRADGFCPPVVFFWMIRSPFQLQFAPSPMPISMP